MQTTQVAQAIWPQLVSSEEWNIYQTALDAVRATNVPFMFGGAFSLATYTGIWRDTKDLDLLILPEHQEVVADALISAGFKDYYETLSYDRGWIYRSFRDGYIVDLIWRMANRRADVDQSWFENALPVAVGEQVYHVVGPEELLWHKVYVMQRERCDWPDVFNLLYSVGPRLDWKRVVTRFGKDGALLNGLLNLFNWLCPGRVAEFPEWLRKQFHLKEPKKDAVIADEANVKFLDSRPWFAAFRSDLNPVNL
ncbi:MAG: hypothetical protein JWM68_1648 [Verrucomicrobiales bacterium]|nr:hypothetical protein [Verrucomicrobiales bacterium]